MELKPCPFCGSGRVEMENGTHNSPAHLHCRECDTYGPAGKTETAAKRKWNNRAPIIEPPVIPCEFSGCGNPADYEGWYRRRDPFLGTPSGHIVRIAFCEVHKSHPYLCANEPKPAKKPIE